MRTQECYCGTSNSESEEETFRRTEAHSPGFGAIRKSDLIGVTKERNKLLVTLTNTAKKL